MFLPASHVFHRPFRPHPGPQDSKTRRTHSLGARQPDLVESNLAWWKFRRPALELRRALAGQRRTLVIAEMRKTILPVFASTDHVFNKSLVVFALTTNADLALLSSSAHQSWAMMYGSG